MIGTRISSSDPSIEEKIDFEPRRSYESGRIYAVAPGVKHQIISDGNKDVGIAISRNGRTDFRQYDQQVNYWHADPGTFIVLYTNDQAVKIN